ncbi:MAG TPA: DUF2249 domain-containing protein, partial [Flavobacteriaceae bacterium]|nr:DUF2249 domain-containing protein [Flavobacteriaceae bacterium]
VADACKIANVDETNFLSELEKIGFEISSFNKEIFTETKGDSINIEKIAHSIDVRPIIDSGVDPFKELIKITSSLKIGEVLEVVNSFEPIPLINVLSKKGFISKTLKKNNVFYTYFKKTAALKPIENDEVDSSNFDVTYKKFIDKMHHIDVRALEMPEPMNKILKALENLPADFCLVVEHFKVPQFLLPELKKRNYKILYNKKSESHYQLLIYSSSERIKNK